MAALVAALLALLAALVGPADATTYEDGSYVTPDGQTGCLIWGDCQD